MRPIASRVASSWGLWGVRPRWRRRLGGQSAAAANDKIRLGLIGAGSRGNQLLDTFLKQPEVDIVAVADVDDKHAAETAERDQEEKREQARHRAATTARCSTTRTSTPSSSPPPTTGTPCRRSTRCWRARTSTSRSRSAHNVAEGQAMIRAARKTNKVMAVGTQQRSSTHFQQGRRDRPLGQARQGLLGPDLELREHQPDGHGPLPPTPTPPPHVDYDRWLGPAPQPAVQPEPVPPPLPLVLRLRRRHDERLGRPPERHRPLGPRRQGPAARLPPPAASSPPTTTATPPTPSRSSTSSPAAP